MLRINGTSEKTKWTTYVLGGASLALGTYAIFKLYKFCSKGNDDDDLFSHDQHTTKGTDDVGLTDEAIVPEDPRREKMLLLLKEMLEKEKASNENSNEEEWEDATDEDEEDANEEDDYSTDMDLEYNISLEMERQTRREIERLQKQLADHENGAPLKKKKKGKKAFDAKSAKKQLLVLAQQYIELCSEQKKLRKRISERDYGLVSMGNKKDGGADWSKHPSGIGSEGLTAAKINKFYDEYISDEDEDADGGGMINYGEDEDEWDDEEEDEDGAYGDEFADYDMDDEEMLEQMMSGFGGGGDMDGEEGEEEDEALQRAFEEHLMKQILNMGAKSFDEDDEEGKDEVVKHSGVEEIDENGSENAEDDDEWEDDDEEYVSSKRRSKKSTYGKGTARSNAKSRKWVDL